MWERLINNRRSRVFQNLHEYTSATARGIVTEAWCRMSDLLLRVVARGGDPSHTTTKKVNVCQIFGAVGNAAVTRGNNLSCSPSLRLCVKIRQLCHSQFLLSANVPVLSESSN